MVDEKILILASAFSLGGLDPPWTFFSAKSPPPHLSK